METDGADPLVGTLLDGRFLILRQLGSGGMGVVYEGVQLAIERRVAIKLVLHADAAKRRDLERLRMEARAVSRLEHPNVIRLYDYVAPPEGRPYIVMELLRGRSLSTELKDNPGPMDMERASWILLQVAEGVGAAHTQGLIHRDLKPGNIWLSTERDRAGHERVKVLDFGLVSGLNLFSERLTSSGMLVGTPHYISPEQVDHPPRISVACDVYAIGVLLFQLVVGHRPFEGETFYAVIDAHLTQKTPSPTLTDAGAAIPPALRRVWNRALQKRPEDRYPDANALCHDLQAAMAEPHAARPSRRRPAATSRARSARSRETIRERKLVTTLAVTLADVADEARLDVEERIERFGALLDECSEAIAAAGGQPELLDGYGVRGIFGLPAAREDDAVRALEAALDICDRLRTEVRDLPVHAGIHTRFALVRAMGGGRERYAIAGDAYEKATSVAKEAAVDGFPVLTGTTHRTVQRFLSRPIPSVGEFGGETAHPVTDTEILDRPEGPPHPFVGRETELDRADGWISEAISGRVARFELFCGPPGMGKSRLCRELGARAVGLHPGLHVLEVHSEGRSTSPYNLFARLLTDAAEHVGGDGPAEKLERLVSQTVSGSSASAVGAPAARILRLIGMVDRAGDPARLDPTDRHRAFNDFADLFGAMAAKGGVLVLVDDLQDADSGSLDLLDHLVSHLADFPLCIIGFARSDPDLLERYSVSLEVPPLTRDSSDALLVDLLGPGRGSARIRKAIVSRADGNPFFLEELARVARDAPKGTSITRRMPDSVRALTGARIDALASADRTTLIAASVVGRVFWTSAVSSQLTDSREATRSTLARLTRAGLVQRQPRCRFEEEEQWFFPSRLVLEVAYQFALSRAVRKGHELVAEWFSRRRGEGQPVPHALIGSHFERARKSARAAHHWSLAGQEASDRYAHADAVAAHEKSLALQSDWSAAQIVTAKLALGTAAHLAADRPKAQELLFEVSRSEVATATQRIQALRYLARTSAWAGEFERSRALLNQAVKNAGNADLRERLLVAADLAYALIRAGQNERAEGVISGSITAAYTAETLGPMLLPLAQLHQAEALLHRNQGRLVQAEKSSKQAVELFEQLDHPAGAATTLTSLSVCLRDMGRFDEAAETALRSAELYREGGYRVHELTAMVNLAWARLEKGEVQAARHLFRTLRLEFAAQLTSTVRVLIDAGDSLAACAMEAKEAEPLAYACLEAGGSAELGEVRGWALYAAGVVLKRADLLEDAATCWRMLDRPAWLARTLEALVRLTPGPMGDVLNEEASSIRARIQVPEPSTR